MKWRHIRRLAVGAAMRAKFAVLQAVAPQKAISHAVKLWCTYPKGRHCDLRPAASAAGASTLKCLPARRVGEVVIESWGSGPVVYLLHGWGGWRGQLGAFVAPLVASGHQVVAIDAPGHGSSGPGYLGPVRGTIMELIEALESASTEFGPAAAVVAHSLGTTAAGVAVRRGLHTKHLVLIAANAGFEQLVELFSHNLKLNARTRAGLVAAHNQMTCCSKLSDFDLTHLSKDWDAPRTLFVHDRHDKQVPFTSAEKVAANWPGSTFLSTNGLGHQRILADPGVVSAVTEFVTAEREASLLLADSRCHDFND